MTQPELIALIEAGETDGAAMAQARTALSAAFSVEIPEKPTTDAMIQVLEAALPSWSLHVQGHSASVTGRWTATVRETGVRDDDELIGVGKSTRLETALLAALLQIAVLRGG